MAMEQCSECLIKDCISPLEEDLFTSIRPKSPRTKNQRRRKQRKRKLMNKQKVCMMSW